MKNKVMKAGAAAVAMMAATTFAGSAQAITVLPPSASLNFGQVAVGGQSGIAGVGFTVDPGTFFIPSVNGLGVAFENSISPAFCNLSSSCLINFVFKPKALGLVSTVATVTFNFGSSSISREVTLEGIGVVPVPGALPLFLTGLGGLAYMARPRRKTATA